MHINDLLKMAVERGASDLHLKVGSHPIIRVDGLLMPMTEAKRLMQEDTIAMAFFHPVRPAEAEVQGQHGD